MESVNATRQKNYLGVVPRVGTSLLLISILLGGCAGMRQVGKGATAESPAGLTNKAGETSAAEGTPEVKIREYILSPGDEINITVFPQEELNRQLTIPPDGHIFYPLIGEIDTRGKSLRELREIILNGLSNYKKSYLVPGDEISITVYRNEELDRQFIIPPEGYIFYPLAGRIQVKGKNLEQVRETIAAKLSRYIVNPQVEVDLVNTEALKIVVDPQVSIGVVGFGGQKVFVLGEVNRPGVFLADGNMGVIEAISAAGGFTLDAKQESILLIRGGMDKSKPELITLNLENFLGGGALVRETVLQRGDIVYVPRTFISNVDRFFQHLSTIISPILSLESGIYIGQQMEGGKGGGRSTVPVR
jgi:polysaccharide export outer membrane protein